MLRLEVQSVVSELSRARFAVCYVAALADGDVGGVRPCAWRRANDYYARAP